MAGFRITRRDMNILNSFEHSPLQTFEAIGIDHFGGRLEATRKRLSKLLKAGLLSFNARPACYYPPHVPPLSPNLISYFVDIPISLMSHEIAITEVQRAICLLVTQPYSVSRTSFLRCPKFGIGIKPDLLIAVTMGGSVHGYGFEVDMGTEDLGRIVSKVQAYQFCNKRGVFASELTAARKDHYLYPLSLVFVCHSRRRLVNMAKKIALSELDCSSVWLTTLEEVKLGADRPIWFQPLDFLLQKCPLGKCLPFYTNRLAYQDEIACSTASLSVA